MQHDTELQELARLLADWTSGTSCSVYLFGSRARSDHRHDSDVDVVIRFKDPTANDVHWWQEQNQEAFSGINARLPGTLHILENNDPLAQKVVAAGRRPLHREQNVICVWLPPMP